VTVAFGIGEPLGSLTYPLMAPVVI
jgi:hypothetical protein